MSRYLNLALIAVCFYDALIMLLLPSTAIFILASDGSAARLVVNMVALGIGLSVLCQDGFKPCANKWFAIMAIFMVFSAAHSPNISFESTFTPKDSGLYNFKPMFEVMVFFLMFMGLSSMEIKEGAIERLFRTIAWIAVIYSGYILLQRVGLDQIYRLTGNPQHMSRCPEAGGFIGQPVFAAAFLAMCMPFVIKTRRYWMVALVTAAIFATGNRTAIIACAISSLLIWKKTRIQYPFGYGLAFVVAGIFVFAMLAAIVAHFIYPNLNLVIADCGRLEVWKGLLLDFLSPRFPGIEKTYIFTGFGIGSFSVLFPFYHHSGFLQAHNEYLEILYTMSVGGLILFGLTMAGIFKEIKSHFIAAGLLAISICAMTNAVWHVAQLQFMTVLLAGIGYNRSVKWEA